MIVSSLVHFSKKNKPSLLKQIILKDTNSEIWGEQESESDSQSMGWLNSNRETPHFDESEQIKIRRHPAFNYDHMTKIKENIKKLKSENITINLSGKKIIMKGQNSRVDSQNPVFNFIFKLK